MKKETRFLHSQRISRKIKGKYNDYLSLYWCGKLKSYKIGKEFRIDKKEFDSFLNKAKTNGKQN